MENFKDFSKDIFLKNTHPETIKCPENFDFIPINGITNDYNIFTFLNESHNLNEIGWNNPNNSKLWNYNLHYFEFLLSENKSNYEIDLQKKIIENWMAMNPIKNGIGWDPYPTSLRIVNWIKWHFKTKMLSLDAKINLWNQVLWLSKNMEYHLMGNHLFINAKALLFASVFFNQNKNSKIYKKAISILNKEIDEQFLSDGAHFELSPMYHSLAMQDLLDIINIHRNFSLKFPIHKFIEKYNRGMLWLKTMTYDNYELSHFNDCANGIAPKINEIEKFAKKIELNNEINQNSSFTFHKESGFIVFKDFNSHLIADFGKVGPDYLPGHAHADTLSFELGIKGKRVIVNSGTSIYTNSDERIRQRSTAAHSTIEIDNKNSSDVWSSFRVGKRAIPFNLKIKREKKSILFSASHNGYKNLKNSPIHNREFNLKENNLIIIDKLSGMGNKITARYYLHPEISINNSELGFIISNNSENLALFKFETNMDLKVIESSYSDRFGFKKSNKCILVSGTSPNKIELNIELL